MGRLKCELRFFTRASHHISQVLTGFLLLKNEKVLDLEIKFLPARLPDCPIPNMVEAVIEGRLKVAYDMLDGYNFNRQKVEKYLQGVDCYFKRSYNPEYHKDFRHAARIYPYGFNYHVTTPKNMLDQNGEIASVGGLARRIKNALFPKQRDFYVEQFEDIPREQKDTRILFLARAWDPDEEGIYLDERLKEERQRINAMRAECIRKLRENFGAKFVGGFNPSPFARRNFADCVVEETLTKRTNFMGLVKKASTCIATMGLHESNGGKLAEYIAASKAIASEQLRYIVPGNFQLGENYLEFVNADHCVEQVMKLETDKKLAFRMRINNYNYYHQFLRADRLIINTLAVALTKLMETKD